ncbi:aspartate aminotransferase family protein [Paenibacillus alkaliterrae]|uniref:pyridoxal phosphate-dependent decarboxylase family protein n=1 Tax=Paenibacillus alkaliterrae TaxID=320909 RepID=UPI001F36A43E|nr:aspartate aminotransferase family protein [Paenibacillus alkaliterrae]MCF2938673.1 aspartate aminotransferase family protein [Paenibacillus alkaliterrae]
MAENISALQWEKRNQTLEKHRFDRLFLHSDEQSIAYYQNAMKRAQEALLEQFSQNNKPYSGLSPEAFSKLFNYTFGEVLPEEAGEMGTLIERIGETVLKHSIVVSDPACLAHLHCPPLSAALAAEVMISGSNQSMDSWDQSAAATVLEQKIIDWLCEVLGYGQQADGVFTSGGTQSNFMGLLLARDRYLQRMFNWSAQRMGLPPQANKLKILCSKQAHFTVRQSAFLLGLGDQAVIPVDTDDKYRMCIKDLDRRIKELQAQDLRPFALVATAGTTDFGSIDPLEELAVRAREHQMWFHVDAAYGGALMLSERHQAKLNGIHFADSVTVDFHKLFYQPISCGAFLVKDRNDFDLIKLNADYLNPEDDEERGIPNLVTKSVQTTRRFDALKLFISLQAVGRKTFGEMIDYTIDLASETAQMIQDDPALELVNEPEINAIVFRYLPQDSKDRLTEQSNWINGLIRSKLLQEGHAVLARTRVNGLVCLKFTLLNPRTSLDDIRKILNQVKRIGGHLAKGTGE